jgi:hypothetical protein
MVFNNDDSINISHHNQHFEVLSNCIPYTIILATFFVAPPWPIIKGQSIINILFNTHGAPARSLQKDDLW